LTKGFTLFSFSFLIALVILVIVLVGISPFMQSPFQYEPDPEIERTFRLRRKKQRLEKQRRKARETNQLWQEEEVSKEGHFKIWLPQESKALPQALLILTCRQTILSSGWLSFPWCNNPNLAAPYWKTLTYTSRSF